MVKKFLEYDVNCLWTIQTMAKYAHEILMLEYSFRHNEHKWPKNEWMMKRLQPLYNELSVLPDHSCAVGWLLKQAGWIDMKAKVESLINEYQGKAKRI